MDELLKIPDNISSILLPSPSLSITALLRYSNLPGPCHFPEDQQPEILDWLSTEPSSAAFLPAQLIQIPLPPFHILVQVHTIVQNKSQTSDICSIQAHHLPPENHLPWHLPLWVLTYWKEVYRFRQIRQDWDACVRWMVKKSAGVLELKELHRRILTTFSHLRWDAQLGGDVAYGRIESLTRLLGNRQLSGDNIAQLVRTLQERVQALSETLVATHLLVNVDFTCDLADASISAMSEIDTKGRYKRLRDVEIDLVRGVVESVGGVLHINGNHYTFFVLNIKEHYLGYADSFGNMIPVSVRKMFTWWIERLVSKGLVLDRNTPPYLEMWIRELPVTRQKEDDGFSCGILALNGLAHHYLCSPLLTYEDRGQSLARMRMEGFLDITKTHRDSETFQDVAARSYFESEFTFTSSTTKQSDLQMQLLASSQQTILDPLFDHHRSSPVEVEMGDSLSTVSEDHIIDSEADDNSIFSETEPNIPVESEIDDLDSEIGTDVSEFNSTPIDRALKVTVAAEPQTDHDLHMEPRALAKVQSRLLHFFETSVSDEVYAAQHKRFAAEAKERWERTKELKEALDAKVQSERRENDRFRQQRSRKRKMELEIEEGVRNVDGKRKPKLKVMRLEVDSDVSTALPASLLPEATRPHRAFKVNARLKKDTRGRKQTKPETIAKKVNRMNPLVFRQLDVVVRLVGYPYSPKEIVRVARQRDKELFGSLHPQRISDWRDPSVSDRFVWKESVLKQAGLSGNKPCGEKTHFGILDSRPEVVNHIQKMLVELRRTGVPLDLVTIRGLMIGVITHYAPEIFERTNKKGVHFRCTDAYVRSFLKKSLNWTIRRGTQASQKVPVDADTQLYRLFLRLAARIRDENIDPSFIVNTDQTQVIYAPGASVTYEEAGSKQVGIVGAEEKRAFTLVVGVSLGGEALPFQAVYQGSDPSRSLPKKSSPFYENAIQSGFKLVLSKTTTYWSTQDTMKAYVTDVLVPHYEHHKDRLNKTDQVCLWLIDVWSVHRSKEFRTWMRKNYPWILLNYVPGGCTGLGQPCDVGIQRVLKHTIRRTAHADIVQETLGQLSEGVDPKLIKLDKRIGVVRDRSVQWIVNGFKTINNEALVLKAWECCKTGSFDLSYASLTSREARQALNALTQDDPDFYSEITRPLSDMGTDLEDTASSDDEGDVYPEDVYSSHVESDMDSSVGLSSLLHDTLAVSPIPEGMQSISDVDIDDELTSFDIIPPIGQPSESFGVFEGSGPGKRARKPNRLYDEALWTRFDD